MFADYIAHGWKLCRIEPGSKSPKYQKWNEEYNAITTEQGAKPLQAAGLLHAYSKTAALDLDDIEKATAYLLTHGIDLSDLLLAPDAVQISSGRPNRGKLLYAMSEPLPSKSFAEGAFELRCGTAGGKSAQDVLPPSLHPSGVTYKWVGDWRKLPPIPEGLLSLWRGSGDVDELHDVSVGNSRTSSYDEIRSLLNRRDPNSSYDEWIRIGMAIHHATGGSEEGLRLWDEWSQNIKE